MSEFGFGIDVGSTTVKLVICDMDKGTLLHARYRRHFAKQIDTVRELLAEAAELFPAIKMRGAVCGSGGKSVAERLELPYVQEVVANAAAVCRLYPETRTAIELGGQDAKIIFFNTDPDTGVTSANDMRMNGSCAGGTGAFIDEIAKLLNVRTEEFNDLASRGKTIYDISGCCGVFAKTDIQPLLIQGAKREDIALSVFHAMVRQTIGGLAQGLEIKPPVIFEGGPLCFNSALVSAFAQRLFLKENDILIPDHPETIVALGAALSTDRLFKNSTPVQTIPLLLEKLERSNSTHIKSSSLAPFFTTDLEKEIFIKRHSGEQMQSYNVSDQKEICAYIGIDSGSTTSKIAVLDENEQVIDTFYAPNKGEPIKVVRQGLLEILHKYKNQGINLHILGVGSTGYGEEMIAKAFGADYHTVETVAHARGCLQYMPDASFILDIGGQDMKAIWINDGIITNILLNEACSSGCGSFLENFASSLGIRVEDIAEKAFSSKHPAALGSRCTVFMNSTIINEQREGRSPEDLMAGLCRSIIENVFTKVVRLNNTHSLGNHVVVQGGTFKNLAVVKAMEDYIGQTVHRAPFPGEMGAIGVALLAKEYTSGNISSFIGMEELEDFSYEIKNSVSCQGCNNHCGLTVIDFKTRGSYVTGNRCEKGQIYGGAGQSGSGKKKARDLFAEREKRLFEKYPCYPVREHQGETIGLPRVLEFWDSMPFWSTFFRALGYDVLFSHRSTRKQYEQGLGYVASDTICFPAKLVHGHILDLAGQQVDRIFFPYIMHMPPEGKDKMSPYVCSVVQGYPMVIKNNQDPESIYGIPFDTPVFHWFKEKGRKKQILNYARTSLGASDAEAQKAYHFAEQALLNFRNGLRRNGEEILEDTKKNGRFAVVLAGRPYHSDPIVNHRISGIFSNMEIPVLPLDALPGLNDVELSNTTVEITNNFHTRMLAGAMIAAEHEELQYVQLISFGCGHDAILSDEIVRILKEQSGKHPLSLKIDESEASGALNIRIRSFVESVLMSTAGKNKIQPHPLPDPSPYKFYKKEKKKRTLLIPNISPESSAILGGILEKEGFLFKAVPIGGTAEIRLGKKYVHNDICFPAQMVIGELIGAIQKGGYRQDEVAVAMVKFQCDCRMSHYAALLRKALDNAGYKEVPVVTTDILDTKNMHPGVHLLGVTAAAEAIWGFMMLDILKELVRKIRPYECIKGETDKIYEQCVDDIARGLKENIRQARHAFERSIERMKNIRYDRSSLKPTVFVTGELLVTYHPGSNFEIEHYLEANGMETIFPRLTDQLRKDFFASGEEIKQYNADIPPYPFVAGGFFNAVQKKLEKIAVRHPLYQMGMCPDKLYHGVEDIIPSTLSCGEGWLMAAEIDHYAREGTRSFVILQPFGCLPNHICGRGVIKSLKAKYPGIQILPLDLDPDTSFANVENRLQMLMMKV